MRKILYFRPRMAKILLENPGKRKVKIYVLWPEREALCIVNFYVQRAGFYQNLMPARNSFASFLVTEKKN
jgi:hypothetical protein